MRRAFASLLAGSGLALTALADVTAAGGRAIFLTVSNPAVEERLAISAPVFEIDGHSVTASVGRLERVMGPTRLKNGVDESVWTGALSDFPDARISVTVRESPLTPVARFRYELSAAPGRSFRLTKKSGRDALVYGTCGVSRWAKARTEVRFNEYDSLSHAYRPSEHDMAPRAFENSIAFQGPFLSFVGESSAALLAYEHGSQAPLTFLEFACAPDETVTMRAVKGNYPANRVVTEDNPFESVWFQAAVVKGGADELAAAYRDFQLKRCTVNAGSRKPYVFYNTWASQERDKWWDKSGDFMNLMNEKRILEDVDIAHELGVDVFVVDVSWFRQTGDWIVDEKRFPHGLGVVRERLRKHGMKMGLWFNPTEAAKNSAMMARNRKSVMSMDGGESPEHSVWSTPGSQNICVVSPYWKDFADRLIEIARELDVTYFKWDGISQFGCDSPDHDHGDAATTAEDRHDCYSFEQVRYLCKIVDRICDAIPDAIVDFDVTEGGRCVGLAFLSSGKYFATNNGPYYPSLDIPFDWEKTTVWCNPFVYPGPARTWICRASIDYDRWIPSVLFLCHFLPDAPRESELINLGSLMLGPNGVWGNLQVVPPEGRRLFGEALAAYKQVRDDVTAASPVRVGRIGASPEIHEKIAPNGNGLFVMFANEGGEHVYVTERAVAPVLWKSEGVAVERDAKGRAILRCHFEKPSAAIVLFGGASAAADPEPQWISAAAARAATEAEKKAERAPAGTSRFFRSVENEKEVVRATYTASGLGVFELYVNGARVGGEVLKPGFTHGKKTKYSYTYDVTHLVRKGSDASNVFGARVSTGWWNDQITGFIGQKSALWGRIDLVHADGSTKTVVTDTDWTADVSDPVRRAGIFDGETYDARWEGACTCGSPQAVVNDEFKGEILPACGAKIVARDDLALVPVEAYTWRTVTNATDGAFGSVVRQRTYAAADLGNAQNITLEPGETLVVDFGQNAAAVPEFTAKAASGTVLTILPAEMLNDCNGDKSRGNDGPEGSVYRVNLRLIHETGARVVYTFGDTDPEKEEETYRPLFTFFGYRYASITATDRVTFSSLRSIPITSIMKEMERGSIVTGNADVNRLIANVYWGQLSNYLSVPTDCPQRNERQGWTADTQVFAKAGSFNADTYEFFCKFMRDMRDTQTECGSYTGVAPFGQYGDAGDQRFGWADCGVIVPYVMWRQTGLTEMLAEHWASMETFMDWLRDNRYAKDRALEYQWGDWVSYEDYGSCGGNAWENGKLRPETALYWKYLGACYWLSDARMMREMAVALGKAEAAAKYMKMADEALAYIRRDILEGGRIPACLRHMQTPALFALHFGILEDGAEIAATKEALLKNIREHGDCLQTGFLGASIIMDTLTYDVGAPEVAYTLLLQHKNPSWLYSVDQGATTIWERWNGYTKDKGFGPVWMNSFNHYAYGAVLAWIYETAAGIQSGPSAGWDTFVLAPIPDRRIGSVDASFRSPKGEIKSAWRYEDGVCRWKYTIPDGTTATVRVNGTETIRTAGTYSETINGHDGVVRSEPSR